MTPSRLERRVRFLTGFTCSLTLLLLVVLTGAFSANRTSLLDRFAADVFNADTVFARVLVTEKVEVVDQGVVRVRLGGQLPDAVVSGKRVPRGGDAAGVLLYDATGQERSGYVTFDDSGNVLLTLDGRASQTAYFVADTSGVTALRIWHDDDAIDLRADEDGARMSVVREGSVVVQEPAAREPGKSATCRKLRDLRAQYDDERIQAACRTRMTDAWCNSCLN